MKTFDQKMAVRRLRNRPKTTVSIRLPQDIVEDLTEMAPILGIGSPEALIRAYISEGMRKDEARLEQPEVRAVLDSLERHGVADEVIADVMAATLAKTA